MSHRIKPFIKSKKLSHTVQQTVSQLKQKPGYSLLLSALNAKHSKFSYKDYFPEHSKNTSRLLNLRKMQNIRTPHFNRYKSKTIKRLPESWRKPKGLQSKCRLQLYGTPAHPRIGYGKPKSVRHLNQKGCLELVISNLNELKTVIENKTKIMIVTSSKLGLKKKLELQKIAQENNLFVKNKINLKKYIS